MIERMPFSPARLPEIVRLVVWCGVALSFSLLGQPEITGAAGPIRLRSKKGQALLWYVAAQPDRAFPRAHLASLLWEDAEESDGRHSLSMTLQRLRADLPVWPIAVRDSSVGWDPASRESGVRLDTTRFDECVAAADRDATAGRAPTESLRAAVALWRGPFLEGLWLPESAAYEEWLRAERRHWESRVIDALGRLAELEAAMGAWEELAAHARRGLEIDPLQERFHRSLMRAVYECGDRAAAAQQYEECERLLREELNLAPEPATTALRDAIASGGPVRADATDGRGEGYRGQADDRAAGAAPSLPLIGREREWPRLAAALSRAARGAGRAVVLHGDAGIGKTRLVEEILWRSRQSSSSPQHGSDRARQIEPSRAAVSDPARQGVPAYRTVLVGHGYEATRELPYAPVVEALNRLVPTLDIPRLGLSDVWLAELSRLLPDIAGAGLPRASAATATYDRHRLFESVARFLAALPAPALLVLEDLHAADPATVQLLAYLVRSPVMRGVSFLVTIRAGELPEGSEPLLRTLEREGLLAWEEVGPLSRAAVRSLQAAVAGGGSADLAERLYDWSQGNPLFAVELLRAQAARGDLDVGDGQPHAARPHTAGPDSVGTNRADSDEADPGWAGTRERLPIPQIVQAVVHSRLERLSPDASQLLDAAAIAEDAVPLDTLRQMADLALKDAVGALGELVRARLLRETGDVGGSRVAFEHDLVRLAICARLTRSEQEALHRRAFQCLAETATGLLQDEEAAVGEAPGGGPAPDGHAPADAAPDGEGSGPSWLRVDRVVYHALAGARWEEALTWSLAAARAAERLSLNSTCVRFLEQALRCLDQLPSTKARRQQAVDIRLRLAYVGPHFRPERVPGWLEAAADHAERLGDDARRARVAAARAMIDFFQGQMMEGLELLGNALPLARSSGDAALLLDVLMSRATLVASQGDFERAIPLLEEAAEEADALQHPRYVAGSRASLALVHGLQGRFDRAVSMFEELIEDCRARRDVSGLGYAFAFRAITLGARGDWEAALTDSREAIRWAEELGYAFQIYIARLPLGPALLHQGDTTSARAAQERTLDLARESATRVRLGHAYAWMGTIERAAGRLEAAERAAQTGLAIAEEQGARHEAALCMKVLGEVAASAGREEDASGRLAAALETFHTIGARPEAARCHGSLATVAPSRADRRQHDATAREMFSQMGITWDRGRFDAV